MYHLFTIEKNGRGCMNKIIIQDTREHINAIGKINKQFEDSGHKVIRSKMVVGDYQFLDNPYFVIDRKQNLQELCGNVCQQHKRFKAELQRANELGIKICILVEHGGNIKCLEDVKNWYNPRLKNSPKAINGERLFKILNTMSAVYNVDFKFCKKCETGIEIIRLLKENCENE